MLVVIEGPDAAGKKTQTEMLAAKLRESHRTLLFSFPRYETVIGGLILADLKDKSPRTPERDMALQSLMSTDKLDAVPEIKDALAHGDSVVCDRWWQSGVAYGVSDGLPALWLCRLGSVLPEPNLNILIDVNPETALARRPEVRDRYEADREKQKMVRTQYRLLWDAMSEVDDRWVVINGERSIDEVHGAIVRTMKERIPSPRDPAW